MQLMAKSSLDWEELKRLLKARSVATHAFDVLVGNHFDGATSFKREVSVVYNKTKSSTHRACDPLVYLLYCGSIGIITVELHLTSTR